VTTLLKPGLLALGLLLAAALVVVFASRAVRLASDPAGQEFPGTPTVPNAASIAAQVDYVPGMDAAASANTETATFALG
jgi:hypothetical protein